MAAFFNQLLPPSPSYARHVRVSAAAAAAASAFASAAGEVCFYLKQTREQFRVRGRLQVVGVKESNEVLANARRHQWTRISPASRASFATSLIPGFEVPARSEQSSPPSEDDTLSGDDSGPDLLEKDHGAAGEGATAGRERERLSRQRGRGAADVDGGVGESPTEPVSDEFCLVLLWPRLVDHLRLGDTQTRNVHKIDGNRDGGGAPLKGGGGPGAERWMPEPVAWVTMAVNP